MIVIINNKYVIINNYNELMRIKYENNNNTIVNIKDKIFFSIIY